MFMAKSSAVIAKKDSATEIVQEKSAGGGSLFSSGFNMGGGLKQVPINKPALPNQGARRGSVFTSGFAMNFNPKELLP